MTVEKWLENFEEDFTFQGMMDPSINQAIQIIRRQREALTAISIPAPEMNGEQAIELVRVHEAIAKRTRADCDRIAGGEK